MSRIKLQEAREYLQLSRDSFKEWCAAVRLVAYEYEFSRRQYFLRGEFFANADAELIQRLQDIHGENWGNYYNHFNDVRAFLDGDKNLNEQLIPVHSPKYSDTKSFLDRLKK